MGSVEEKSVETNEEITIPEQLSQFEPVAHLAVGETAALAENAVKWADALVVENQKGVDEATVGIRGAKEKRVALDKARDFLVRPLNSHVAAINDIFRGPIALFKGAEATVKSKAEDYLKEQERKRQEAQRKADAEARRIENIRLAAAAKAQERGDTEKAQELVARAYSAPATVVPPEVTTSEGSHTSQPWKARITNSLELIKAIASGVVPYDPDMIIFKQSVMDEKARGYRGTVKWPGVEFYQDVKLSVRK
jgi:hypothetical protein